MAVTARLSERSSFRTLETREEVHVVDTIRAVDAIPYRACNTEYMLVSHARTLHPLIFILVQKLDDAESR